MDTASKIIEFNNYTDLLTEYTYELKQKSNKSKLEDFSKLRDFPMEEIESSDIFYIGNAVEMLIPKYLDVIDKLGVISPTNKKPIFHDRYVMPIKDTDGRILNLVGYSKEADERYVYGTAKYYRRRDTMYGLENLPLAYDLGFGILVEGITDTVRVRGLGYKNCFATCGTHEVDFIMKQLNRCRYGIIKIGDRDAPGRKAVKKWTVYRGINLNTFVEFKDIDAMCFENDDNKRIVKMYIDSCIDWITSSEHKFCKGQQEEVTMYI